MGGFGSGMGIRPNRKRSKKLVQEYRSIDAKIFSYENIQKIPEGGLLTEESGISFHVFKDRIELTHKGIFESFSYAINFTTTKANYGNDRYWFICSGNKCHRRCRKLYMSTWHVERPFLCRKCLNLAYKSQNQTEMDRMCSKKWNLIEKLGCDSSYIGDTDKPKWMHKKTFNNMRDEIEGLDRYLSMRLSEIC